MFSGGKSNREQLEGQVLEYPKQNKWSSQWDWKVEGGTSECQGTQAHS